MINKNNGTYIYGMKIVTYKRADGTTYSRRRKHVLATCDRCGDDVWVRADNAIRKMVTNANSGVTQLSYYCQRCRPIGSKLDIQEI